MAGRSSPTTCEDGDKSATNSAGQLALPKSIVDHIEKGGLVPMMGSPAAAAPAWIWSLRNSRNRGESEIDKGAVQDGSVDPNYINRLEAGWRRAGDSGGTSASGGGAVRNGR